MDFRRPQYGFSQSFMQGEHGMSNRLPFVVTNPPKDLVLQPSDLIFVLGRPRPEQSENEDEECQEEKATV